jgi:predicted nucleic acid-binding Zn ribbon protein
MGENDAVLCPSCSSEAKRVFTPVGVAFKGSGFHNTDYRQKPAAEPTVSCPAKSDTSPKCEGCPSAS